MYIFIECSEGIHNCVNASDCMDTEGGHYCISTQLLTATHVPTESPTNPSTEITSTSSILMTVAPSSTKSSEPKSLYATATYYGKWV